nr:variable surface lipoprotein [Mycoplasmopsis bovis]
MASIPFVAAKCGETKEEKETWSWSNQSWSDNIKIYYW